MKKFLKNICFILITMFLLLIFISTNDSKAYNKTYTLEFKTIDANEKIDIYVLLPKEYIIFAIKEDKLDIEYKGVETLIENDIPSIKVKKENISSELYEENEKEYIQILLEQDEDGIYKFDILSDYGKLDIKFRIKNINKDFIAHIDNFKIDDDVCKIEYNYKKDTIKQPNTKFIPFMVKFLIFVLVAVIVVGIIAYVKKGR